MEEHTGKDGAALFADGERDYKAELIAELDAMEPRMKAAAALKKCPSSFRRGTSLVSRCRTARPEASDLPRRAEPMTLHAELGQAFVLGAGDPTWVVCPSQDLLSPMN